MKVKLSVTFERDLMQRIEHDRGVINKSQFINQLCRDGFKQRKQK